LFGFGVRSWNCSVRRPSFSVNSRCGMSASQALQSCRLAVLGAGQLRERRGRRPCVVGAQDERRLVEVAVTVGVDGVRPLVHVEARLAVRQPRRRHLVTDAEERAERAVVGLADIDVLPCGAVVRRAEDAVLEHPGVQRPVVDGVVLGARAVSQSRVSI